MIAGQRNSDLTEGIIWKTLIIFTVPILVGNFFQHLYTTADAVIVGRFTGKEGLAAIDSIFSLLRLPVNLFSGLSAGSSILISQLYGAKKYGRIKKITCAGLVMGFCLIGFISTILYFFNVPLGKLFISAKDYGILSMLEKLMHILSPFYILFVFAEIFSVIIQGTGETFKPMLLTLLGICVSRIVWILFIIPKISSIEIIIWAFPLSWTFTSLIFTVYYCIRSRMLIFSR